MPTYSDKPTGAIYDCPMTGLNDDCKQVKIEKSKLVQFNMIYKEQFLGMNLVSATVYKGSSVFVSTKLLRNLVLLLYISVTIYKFYNWNLMQFYMSYGTLYTINEFLYWIWNLNQWYRPAKISYLTAKISIQTTKTSNLTSKIKWEYEFITCALSMYILIRQSLCILLWKPFIKPHQFRTISVIGNPSLSPQTCAPRRQAKDKLSGRELILGSCYNFTNALDTYKELTINFKNREGTSTHQLYWLSLVGMSAATNQRNHLLTGAPFSSFKNVKPWIESGEVYFSRGTTEDNKHFIGKSIAAAALNTTPLYPGKNKGIHKD